MFYPYEGYRSVTPLDAARVNTVVARVWGHHCIMSSIGVNPFSTIKTYKYCMDDMDVGSSYVQYAA